MKKTLPILMALYTAATHAEPLQPVLEFVEADVPLTDPATFEPTTADVYHLRVTNPNAFNVYTFSLDFPNGMFFAGPQSVGRGTAFPVLGPFTVADSFLVVNQNAPSGAVNPVAVIDTETRLSGTVTVLAADPTNGNAPVSDADRVAIPAGGSAVLAVLAVPAGSLHPSLLGYTGSAVVGGNLEWIDLYPEPSTAMMTVIALSCVAARRRARG